VLLVVLWHAGVPGFSAGFVGVDVFFVISGFLITRLIAAEIAARGRLSLIGFYGRRARRLLPSAGLVLCVATVLGYLLLPPIRWRDTAGDVIASALYVVNWRFAERAVDYLAADQAPSIVQHYWSLSVEEQFYLLWPLLLAAVALVVRRRGRPHRFVAASFVVVALLVVVSFGWSVLLTATDPARAYFDTTVRIWELGAGALLALWPAPLRMRPGAAATLGWAGLAALLGAAVVFDTRTPFPGAAALLPTVGTALVIVAGGVAGAAGPDRLLRSWPLTALGRISYPLYLWHWPLLVVFTARYGELSLPVALAVVLLSLVLAELTGRFVERPIRRARIFRVDPQAALQTGLACTIVSLISGFVLLIVAAPPPPQLGASAPRGAEAVRSSGAHAEPVDQVPHITPDPLVARDDLPEVYRAGCHVTRQESAVRGCTYGSPTSDFTVALVGDSHAAQWVPAFQRVAQQRGWRLTVYTKSQCPVLDVTVAGADLKPDDSCAVWSSALRDRLRREQPQIIATSSYEYRVIEGGTPLSGAENRRALVESMRRTWQGLAAGSKVVVLRDTPAPRIDIAECVSVHREQLTRCAVPRDEALTGIGPLQVQAAQGLDRVWLLDLNDAICPGSRCPAVIGGVLVYRDTNHLTATYARSLGPLLDERLEPVLR